MVGFSAAFRRPQEATVTVRLTASTLYRLYVNGAFAGYGPARGPYGWFRIDEWDVTHLLKEGANIAAVEVAGYNVNSYYMLDQPSFLQAEIVAGGKVLASTHGGGAKFTARVLTERVQKVQRYSFQRPFSEVYRLQPGADDWRREAVAGKLALAGSTGAARLLVRGVPYPRFQLLPARQAGCRGHARTGHRAGKTLARPRPHQDWSEAGRLQGRRTRVDPVHRIAENPLAQKRRSRVAPGLERQTAPGEEHVSHRGLRHQLHGVPRRHHSVRTSPPASTWPSTKS